MSFLLTADIHLNENKRDEARWGLIPWICDQVKKYKIDEVIIAGDATDSKDRHPATLVNKFADQISALSKLCRVFLMKGNHDCYTEEWPFFEFTDYMPNVNYITEAKVFELADKSKALFLPFCKNWSSGWLPLIEEDKYDWIFCHATFEGCLSENGTKLNGIPTSIFDKHKSAKVWAGDIHVPQSIGPVEYVGAPYRTRFGDSFEPRCVLINNRGKASDLRFPCPSKELVVISNIRDLEKQSRNFNAGDWVKVRVKLMRSEYVDWPKLKQDIVRFMEKNEFKLVGPELVSLSAPKRDDGEVVGKNSGTIDSKQVVQNYAKAQRADKRLARIGLEVLEEVK